ncbi:hypothetical protein BDZ97DRAFT_1922369 [Flammula alnicola]|nr:hypothetical protein BDZ97DRAFT_1922369 [Flammula alnicola]
MAVRSDDRAAVKSKIPQLLLVNTDEPLLPPIIKPKKEDRGYYHSTTATLLCPIKYEAKKETYASIRAHTLPVTAAMLPCFLFPEGHILDQDDMLKDVAKLIFQGPSTALANPGAHRGKQGNAAICGLSSMTPHTIAYIVMQAHFAMTSTATWSNVDGTFNYIDFYWKIVGLFDDSADSKELISFFNHHVFGTTDATDPLRGSSEPIEDEFEIAMRQRAAKHACTIEDF